MNAEVYRSVLCAQIQPNKSKLSGLSLSRTMIFKNYPGQLKSFAGYELMNCSSHSPYLGLIEPH